MRNEPTKEILNAASIHGSAAMPFPTMDAENDLLREFLLESYQALNLLDGERLALRCLEQYGEGRDQDYVELVETLESLRSDSWSQVVHANGATREVLGEPIRSTIPHVSERTESLAAQGGQRRATNR